MGTQFFKQANGLLVVVLLALVLVLGDRVTTGRAAPNAVMQPVLVPQVFNVNCTSLAAITPTYAKLLDMATFAVQSPDSIVEVTFNGRIFVGSFSAGTGALFELRVDDQPSTTGRARANMRTAEAGGGGVQASITGFFSGLLVDLFYGSFVIGWYSQSGEYVSHTIVGIHALLYLLIGYFIGYTHRFYSDDDYTLPLIIVAVSNFVYKFFYYIFEFLLRGRLNLIYYLRRFIIPEVIYTVAASVLVYKILHMINHRLNRKDEDLV